MNITNWGEHMMKNKEKEHKLPNSTQGFITPLQKKILFFLALNQPQTINETVKAISGNYRSSWDAFKELEKKNLINPIDKKYYRGRYYDRFWVTESGVLYALGEKAKSEVLLRRTQEIYPEKKDLQFLIEIIPILGESAHNIVRLEVITNGKVDQNDLISIFATQKKLGAEEMREYSSILRKYPERYKQHVDYIKKASKQLIDLSKMLDN
jgi:hypothetical protein